jgi:rhomboid protease GluP
VIPVEEPAAAPPLEPPPLPAPRATWALLAANVAMFGLQTLWGGSDSGPTLLRMGANVGRIGLLEEPWRLLSSAFLHIGVLHLALNMWALWIFGSALERILGPARLIVLYGVSALGGGLLSALVHPRYLAAGASGAVWGLMAAELVLILRLRRLHGPEAVPGGWSVLQPMVINLLFSLAPGIDLAAHLGGGITGAIFLLGFTRRSWIQRDWKPAALATALLMAASVGLALWSGRPWELG